MFYFNESSLYESRFVFIFLKNVKIILLFFNKYELFLENKILYKPPNVIGKKKRIKAQRLPYVERETIEEKRIRLEKDRIRMENFRRNMSPETKQRYNEKNRNNVAKYRKNRKIKREMEKQDVCKKELLFREEKQKKDEEQSYQLYQHFSDEIDCFNDLPANKEKWFTEEYSIQYKGGFLFFLNFLFY